MLMPYNNELHDHNDPVPYNFLFLIAATSALFLFVSFYPAPFEMGGFPFGIRVLG